MASGPNPVAITIGGDSTPLQKAAQEAKTALGSLAEQVNRTSAVSAEASRGLGGLGESLQAYRKEETQQVRSVRFFANELQGLVPVSADAAHGMSKLAMVIGAGSILGASIEAAKWGIETLVEKIRESAEEERLAAEAAKKMAAEVGQMWDRIASASSQAMAKLREREKTAPEKEADQAVAAYSAELEKIKELILTKTRERDAALREHDEKVARRTLAELEELERRKQAVWVEGQALWNTEKLAAEQRDNARMAKEAARFNYENDLKIEDAKTRAHIDARRRADEEEQAYWQAKLATFRDRGTAERDAKLAMFWEEQNRLQSARQKAQEAESRWRDAQMAKEVAAEKKRNDEMIQDMARFSTTLVSSFTSAFRPMLTQSAAYSRAITAVGGANKGAADLSAAAFAAMAQDALASLAVQAAQKAVFYTAEGIAMAVMGNPGAAGMFASAAMMAGIAGGAGVGAYEIGQHRGMTAAERQQVAAQGQSGSSSLGSSSGAPSGSGGGGEKIMRETVFVIAPGGFTESEVARVTARAMRQAERLGYTRGMTATEGK